MATKRTTKTPTAAKAAKAKTVYTPAPGAHLTKKDAVAVGTVIDTLVDQRGSVTAEALVKAARSLGSPIHHLFEWDNGKAAAQYRLAQARTLIRSIVVTVENVQTRAFRSVVTRDSAQGYVPIAAAIRDVDYGPQIVAAARRALESWAAQYGALAKLAGFKPVFKAIERLAAPPKARKRAA